MANHKSSKKRSRQTVKKNQVNTVRRSEVKSLVKTIRESIATKDKEKAQKELPIVQKLLARLAKNGIIKNNTAARKTSRLTSQVNGL